MTQKKPVESVAKKALERALKPNTVAKNTRRRTTAKYAVVHKVTRRYLETWFTGTPGRFTAYEQDFVSAKAFSQYAFSRAAAQRKADLYTAITGDDAVKVVIWRPVKK